MGYSKVAKLQNYPSMHGSIKGFMEQLISCQSPNGCTHYDIHIPSWHTQVVATRLRSLAPQWMHLSLISAIVAILYPCICMNLIANIQKIVCIPEFIRSKQPISFLTFKILFASKSLLVSFHFAVTALPSKSK